MKWDGGWYVFTAAHGYLWDRRSERMQNVAFFPAYPMIVRTVGALMGVRVLYTDPRENTSRDFRLAQEKRLVYAGLGVSLAAFVWALRNLYELARLHDPSCANRVLMLAAWYPFAVFYGAVYTERFLLGLTGIWLAIERRAWPRAIGWGFLVGLIRPVGFLVSAAIAVVAWRHARQERSGYLVKMASVLAPIAGTALFSLYLYDFTGSPFQWVHAQEAWNRFNPELNPLLVIMDRAQFIWTNGLLNYMARWPAEFLNASVTIGCLLLVIPIALRLGVHYGVLVLFLIVPALFAGGFMTTGRFTAPVFPIYLYLAVASPPGLWRVLLPAFAAFQALVAALHFTAKPMF